jgi:hypothetical protein
MSTGREKDQKDFDLEQIVDIIDSALESDDQRIKNALRQLMTITVLCTAEHPDQAIKGPLGRLMEDVRDLNRRIYDLEDKLHQLKWDQQKKQIEPFTPPYNPGSPFGPVGTPTTGWPGINDSTKPKPMWGPSLSSGDDPNYKGASAGTTLAEDFLRELEKR